MHAMYFSHSDSHLFHDGWQVQVQVVTVHQWLKIFIFTSRHAKLRFSASLKTRENSRIPRSSLKLLYSTPREWNKVNNPQ